MQVKITLNMVKNKIKEKYIKTTYKLQFKYNNYIFNSSWDNMKQRYKKGC